MRHEKPYWDEDGNWVVPINTLDNKHIFGKVNRFMKHAASTARRHVDIALTARNQNQAKGGNRGTSTDRTR